MQHLTRENRRLTLTLKIRRKPKPMVYRCQFYINPKEWNRPLLTNTRMQIEVNATRLMAAISKTIGLLSAF